MNSSAKHCLAALALAAGAADLQAQTESESGAACALPTSHSNPLMDRLGDLARYEQLPQHCLKIIVKRCDAATMEGVLDFGSAAACSLSYEALLKRGFGGDFNALLVWWQSERRQKSANSN